MFPFVTLWQKWCKAFSQKVVSLPRSNHVREIDLITNTMLEALYVTDVDGNITRANAYTSKLLGYTQEALLGHNAHALFHADSITQTPIRECKIYQAIQERGEYFGEEVFFNQARKKIFVEVAAKALIHQGNVIGEVVTFRDISEQKTYRETLLELLEFSPIAVRIAQKKGKKVVFANTAYSSLIQLNRHDVIGQNPKNYYVHHEDYDAIVHAIDNDESIYNKLIELSIQGDIKWVLASYMPMNFEGEKSVLGWFYDITDKEFHKQELQRQKEEFETIFNISKDGIAVLDAASNFLDFNNAYLEMTGFTREELLTKSCVGLSSVEDQERAKNVMYSVAKYGFVKGFEKTCVVNEGKRIVVNMTLTHMPDKQRILVSAKDITQSKAYEQQLEHIAHYDPLTGLPNRLLNSDRLRQAMVHAQRQGEYIAIAYLDLDGFKEVNDRYGHAMGDKLLTTLSLIMQQTLQPEDTLARLGGDEFVVIIVGLADRSMAYPIIQKLLEVVSQEVLLDASQVRVSASLGVTFYPQYESVDADQLIRQADQAMYEAKQSGKNRYHVFDPDYDRTVRTKHENLERIQHALTNREFVLYYQPKINMRTHTVIGAEALIRWQHPQRGLVPPADFLPIIEIHPLAIDVGEWVIQEAIDQIQRWKAMGLRIPVSVNVGAKQLLQGNFVEKIRSILFQNPDFDPTLLEIEILETSALEDIHRASHIIQSCKTLGIHFALDDFGTGYSSLTYLKRLPIATLKIDQSFVRDMLDNQDDLAILAGIIGLAKAFNRRVIAEGVETYAHGQKLLELGCDLAQGYGIARPMCGDAMVEWYGQWDEKPCWRG
ncbi:MAG: EAL domain-containing protein [Sulfuricurvum sp.]